MTAPATRAGLLIAVVGPSGVGKDTVMEALCRADPSLQIGRRVITRPAKAGGEDFEGVSVAAFEKRRDAGDFVLSWSVHGLHYGIPKTVCAEVAAGQDMLLNLSRGVLGALEHHFDRYVILALTASADTLRARLTARGREDAADIERRLSRSYALPEGLPVITVENNGPVDETVARTLIRLQPERANR
ncbi:MAG: phosphonate metabolism protein/1,5-bisphosphokinase (PRPP-forming) PhnN [Paracoccaceae bacterium]